MVKSLSKNSARHFRLELQGLGCPPSMTRRKKYASAYSKVFMTAEIDSTFYAYPSRGTMMGWLRYTSEGFRILRQSSAVNYP
ncbi:hypothetical protein DRP04_15620 [Archaeoglobales archaeon]|nr:MAG: hypothetical protein DRP04_15620 [Archaeoglobales archaeon]